MASAERRRCKDECFPFGAVIDNEFQMVRDPYESKCTDKDTSARWAVGHELTSFGWRIELGDTAVTDRNRGYSR